jgi:nicotinate-nucleotide adenylyltransferase
LFLVMAISAPDLRPIGVLGGTFDPIHYGHLRLGWDALCKLALQQVMFTPCHLPPHRTDPETAAEHRLAMAHLACADIDGFAVNGWELQQDKPSYSIDTLTHLREIFGPRQPLIFIMGMDAFAGFCRWHRWQELLELCHLCVAHRPHSLPLPPDSDAQQLLDQRTISSAALLQDQPGGLIYLLSSTEVALSSTQLRILAQGGTDLRFLLPDAVYRYIKLHRLYEP